MIYKYVFLLIYLISDNCNSLQTEKLKTCKDCGTELTNAENSPLLISTLDGSFFAVNQRSGNILWTFKQEAIVKVPINEKGITPLFLPDPKDGSLYMLSTGTHSNLKKLQLTIQQLVSASPCRSVDGIFYTGKKTDSWFAIDWITGKLEELIDLTNENRTCLLNSRNSIFLGRTEYNLMMYDSSKRNKHWNITYYDYAVNSVPPGKKNHEFVYFSGSYSGRFSVVENRADSPVLWESDFGSPVVGVYVRDGDSLQSVPFTTIDDESMHILSSPGGRAQFFSTLYIGEHMHGLYALPAIATINSPVMLLDGPLITLAASSVHTQSDDNNENQSISILGHYKMPEYGVTRLRITGRSDPIISTESNFNSSALKNNRNILFKKSIAVQTVDENSDSKTAGNITESINNSDYRKNDRLSKWIDYIVMQENILLKTSMISLFIIVTYMFIYLKNQMKELKQSSNHSSSQSGVGKSDGSITAIAEELQNGTIRVGKIQFRPDQVLGKGCEGTFVFRGEFDNRSVAVKRLLPECFMVADREVCLLRESDQHPNVIRYFCMEQDKQFRYIALELCQTTLHEYVEKGVLNNLITPSEALYQATAGLEHLHALHIVHRDIKPHNVLLSIPSKESNKVRVLISDFGLCKKLQSGRISFSRRSGITGTDGWIAPEIINGKERTTTAVDIFSLGCVFYYVLSKGKHPFGDSLRRQANIISADYKLNDLTDDPNDLWEHIIIKMISKNPSDRPSASVVRCHPAFWDKNTVLSFLQDVSDRIEKEDVNSTVLLELEIGNSSVLMNRDWRLAIEPEIAQDLRKHRNYKGDSLRDLLRALRNKKHHYRELSDPVRTILGPIPDGFVDYWISRFPLLLLHTWITMQCIKCEELFCRYYSKAFTFPRTSSTDVPNWIIEAMYTAQQRSSNNSNYAKKVIIPEISNSKEEYFGSSMSPFKLNYTSINRRYVFLNSGNSCDKDLNWRNNKKLVTINNPNDNNNNNDSDNRSNIDNAISISVNNEMNSDNNNCVTNNTAENDEYYIYNNDSCYDENRETIQNYNNDIDNNNISTDYASRVNRSSTAINNESSTVNDKNGTIISCNNENVDIFEFRLKKTHKIRQRKARHKLKRKLVATASTIPFNNADGNPRSTDQYSSPF